MPLNTRRPQVQGLYAEAAPCRWLLPLFLAENPTITEAILAVAHEYGQRIEQNNPWRSAGSKRREVIQPRPEIVPVWEWRFGAHRLLYPSLKESWDELGGHRRRQA
jgi:hypothetical protein